MTNLSPSMRLKVKRDTFFLPDSETSVYFRNNKNSFRMEGSSIIQWIENLMPMFTGEHTLQELTAGLPVTYQKHVFDIAAVLYQNEFVRDVSKDQPDQLSSYIKEKYQSQIEFLNHFGDSGSYRFQKYREQQVLAIGSGSIFISLISSLIETGLASIHMSITDKNVTNQERLSSLITSAQKEDSELKVDAINMSNHSHDSWDALLSSYDTVLYISKQDEEDEIMLLSKACEERGILFIPAMIRQKTGIAGPIANNRTKGVVASAYRRLHASVFEQRADDDVCANMGSTILANVISFELFKEVTGVRKNKDDHQCYLLNLETLEGGWHTFFTHPLENDDISVTEMELQNVLRKEESINQVKGSWFQNFSYWYSDTSGIFHKWEEGDLEQLPLSQCLVQSVDALSKGPARVLPPIICGALTHEEARRESGLRGVEAYIESASVELFSSKKYIQLINKHDYVGIGAGETQAECIIRGLQKCLDKGLSQQMEQGKQSVKWLNIGVVEDEYCRYLLQSIQLMKKNLKIGIGEDVFGFPVVFVLENDKWFSGTGVQMTQALRHGLQKVIMHSEKNDEEEMKPNIVHKQQLPISNIIISPFDAKAYLENVNLAKEVLQQKQMEMIIMDIQFDKAFQKVLAGVYGILLREKVLS